MMSLFSPKKKTVCTCACSLSLNYLYYIFCWKYFEGYILSILYTNTSTVCDDIEMREPTALARLYGTVQKQHADNVADDNDDDDDNNNETITRAATFSFLL